MFSLYCFLIHMPGTGSGTLLHMVIQTWPVLSAVARKVPATGANLIQFAYQLDHILDRAATGIRTKISVFVLLHSVWQTELWDMPPAPSP